MDSLQPMIDVPRGVWGFLRKKVLPYHGLQDLVKAFYQSLAEGTPVPVAGHNEHAAWLVAHDRGAGRRC